MAQRFEDFDLAFERNGAEYVVRLVDSPMGQASGTFVLPFTDGYLLKFYQRLGQRGRTRRVESPEAAASKQFGRDLFQATFRGELLAQLRASIHRSRVEERPLRLRLRLRDVPELAELPWEFLYDAEQDHFLATSWMTPVIRYLDLPQAVSPLRVRLPLRILVVICSPDNLPRLDAEGEWRRLKDALADLETREIVLLERQELPTLDGLRLRARRDPFHILHFIGHGSFDMNGRYGVLHLENEFKMSDPVPGHILGNILRDHASLRLAVLNACEGARQSVEDAFSGVAQSLCHQRLPAAVAMQFEVSDDAAKEFAYEFYQGIAECRPVEAAVAFARQALLTKRFGQEWATPVLYMRSSDGLLFDVPRKRRATLGNKPKEGGSADVRDHELRKATEEAERKAKEEADRKAREDYNRIAEKTADRKIKPVMAVILCSAAILAAAIQIAVSRKSSRPTSGTDKQSSVVTQTLTNQTGSSQHPQKQGGPSQTPPQHQGTEETGTLKRPPGTGPGTKGPVAPPAKSKGPVRISGGVIAENKISGPQPVYPAIARSTRLSGTVVLSAQISKAGEIESLSVVSGPAMLTDAALNAVKQWKYKPYMLDGEPTEVSTTITVNFRLNSDDVSTSIPKTSVSVINNMTSNEDSEEIEIKLGSYDWMSMTSTSEHPQVRLMYQIPSYGNVMYAIRVHLGVNLGHRTIIGNGVICAEDGHSFVVMYGASGTELYPYLSPNRGHSH